VFLGNLPPDCRVRDIEDFLKPCGGVRNVLIKQRKYGFAEFEDEKDAEDAVHEMHGKKLHGNRIVVELAKGPKKGERRAPWVSKYGAPSRTKYVIKVTNLSSRVSWQDLKDLFRKKGEVCYAEAHTERRNEGRVEMETLEDLERVMRRYQGYEVNGRRLELVEEIQKSRSRSKSRSSTRARSHSEPRSRSSTKRDSQSRSKSKSQSRSRSKSQDKEVDPDDQDIKRQRKRSYSGSSKHSRHGSHSRPQSRQSQPASPARKTLRVAENDEEVEVNDTTDDKSDHET